MTAYLPDNFEATGYACLVLLILFPTVIVVLFAHLLLVVPARNNAKLCVRRRFMCWLGVAGIFGGCAFPITLNDLPLVSVLLRMLAGSVVGLLVGNVLGRIMWSGFLSPKDEE